MSDTHSIDYKMGKHEINDDKLFVCVQRFNKTEEFVIAILIISPADDSDKFLFFIQDFSLKGEKINEITGYVSNMEMVMRADDTTIMVCFSDVDIVMTHEQYKVISEFIKPKKESRIIKSKDVRNIPAKSPDDNPDTILNYTYKLDHLEKILDNIVLKMTNTDPDVSDTPFYLNIVMEKTNELVFDLSYFSINDRLIKEKTGKIQKPYIIERIDEENLLVRVFDVTFEATDEQYEALVDHINSKKKPLQEQGSVDKQNSVTAGDHNEILVAILEELKSINDRLSQIT